MFELPKLKYDYNAFEPFIDAETMEIHHSKHHQSYVDNLNLAITEAIELAGKMGNENDVKKAKQLFEMSLEDLSDSKKVRENVLLMTSGYFPMHESDISTLAGKITANAGGHLNHSQFWEILAPTEIAKHVPEGKLLEVIESAYGSLHDFKNRFKNGALNTFGSGWTWMTLNSGTEIQQQKSNITCTTNQRIDSGFQYGKQLFGLDVWEHAYYLKHQNRRGDYVDSFWNVLDWAKIEDRYYDMIRSELEQSGLTE